MLKGVILPAISHRASTNSNNTTFDLINKLIRSIFDGGPDTDPQSSTTQNIDKIISPLEDEIETCNSDEIDLEALSAALQKRAEAQLTRFSLQRDIINLNRLIYLYEVMTQFLDPSVPNDIHDLRLVLISLLSIRYFLFKESGHLDSLIGSLEEFLSGTQGSQDYGLYRPLLSQALVLSSWDHLDIEPNTKDCDRILQLCDDIPTSTFQAEHSSWRFIKSDAIERLSMLGRKCHNLTDALECLQAGQDIDPELGFPYSVFQVLVSQLKIAVIAGDWQLLLEVEKEIQTRPTEEWLHAGASIFRPDSDADLDKTVEVLRQRYRSCPSGDLCAHLCSIVLAWALLDRFRRLRKFSDIQEAVAFREVFEPDKIFKVDFLLFLQTMEYNSLSENRWRRQEATKGRACDNIPDGINPGPSNSSRFSDAQAPNVVAIQKLAALYGSDSPIGKHMSLRNAILQHADKDEVFQTTRDELLSLCEQSNNPSLYLTDLCMLYQSRYNITNRIEDLETAVKYYLQSLKDPEPASTRGTSFAHILLLLESLKPGSVTPSQFLEMHDFLRGAANDATVVYNDRLDHINWWFRILFARRAVKEERKGHALGMANLTLSLLEQQSWESPTSRAFLDARYDTEGLLTTAAFSIIHSDPTNMPRAIEILERGRSLLWSQLDSLRTPPSALASVPPQLATRFLETSRALQRRMGLSHEIGNDPPGTYHQQIVDDRNQVIEEIRVLTGFEHFLKPKSFSELHTTAAAEGPIVILMPSYSQCLAVVFVRSESVVFPLPISVSRLSDLHGCIQPHQSPRSAGSEVADSLGTSTSSSGDNRAGVRTSKRKLHMDDVLKILWLEVAKPVIDVIMETTGKLKEKNNTPVSSSPLNDSMFTHDENRIERDGVASGGVALGNFLSCPSMPLEYTGVPLRSLSRIISFRHIPHP